jgi:hypothetical protein
VAGVPLPCVEAPQAPGCNSIVGTGPVAASGGSLEASLLCYPPSPNCAVGVPALPLPSGTSLSAEVLHAAVVAQGNTSKAEASVAEFGLSTAGQSIGADILDAHALAKCTGNGAVVQAGGETSVTINGTTYTVAGGETQTIPLSITETLPTGQTITTPIGYVTINEGASNPKSGDVIDASALHIVINPQTTPGGLVIPGTNLYVAKVHADIVCGSSNCSGQTAFVTGGGFITPTGAKLHFAGAGRNGVNWGHLIYKPGDLHVRKPYAVVYNNFNSLVGDAAAFTVFQQKVAQGLFDATKFEGAAILTWPNGTSQQTGTPSPGEALLVDMGEPGRSDFFEIADAGGSLAGGFLTGGNIQMHGKCL